MEAFKPIPQEVMDLLRQSGTGMIKDALAMSGIVAGVAGVRPARRFEDRKLIGQAATGVEGPRPPAAAVHVLQQVPLRLRGESARLL